LARLLHGPELAWVLHNVQEAYHW